MPDCRFDVYFFASGNTIDVPFEIHFDDVLDFEGKWFHSKPWIGMKSDVSTPTRVTIARKK